MLKSKKTFLILFGLIIAALFIALLLYIFIKPMQNHITESSPSVLPSNEVYETEKNNYLIIEYIESNQISEDKYESDYQEIIINLKALNIDNTNESKESSIIAIPDSLKEIFFEDVRDNLFGAKVVFVFENGTIISKDLIYQPCEIIEINCMDITGDGKDEVIVYTYFTNTAAEYCSIYIYEIENDTINEIFPTKDIKEIANEVCNAELVKVIQGGNIKYILNLEIYGKEDMIAYVKDSLTITYIDGKWIKF
ncbi:MAG: hypothetical protein FWC09_02485 [Lachnospiraceae bacterium]|nr:hypothetical protein [Lachnospiraceae bacterium]